MVVGIAEPQQRDKEHLLREPLANASDDFPQEQAVGEHREVMAMLFECGDGDYHWDIPRERGHGGR